MRRPLTLCAGLLCLLALAVCVPSAPAQDESSAQIGAAQTTGAQTTAAPQVEPKKVWTNSDLEDLRANSPISTVGKQNAAQATRSATRSTPARNDQQWYSDQITKLQGQLPPIDQKIAELQAGIDGKFTGDSHSSARPRYAHFGDWKTELAELQKRRADIEARIDVLRDQARQAGIPSTLLP
jgi:chaperonin cofactor prefoldin